jgi:hypothetical protein
MEVIHHYYPTFLTYEHIIEYSLSDREKSEERHSCSLAVLFLMDRSCFFVKNQSNHTEGSAILTTELLKYFVQVLASSGRHSSGDS